MSAFQTITQEASPYSVPTGRRVSSFSFVGAAGGGTLTITANGVASDPIVIGEGEAYARNFDTKGVAVLGGGTLFAWANIARYALELV